MRAKSGFLAVDRDRALSWAAAVMLLAVVLGHHYPAMVDLPCHEEIVAAMRHFGDRERYPEGLMQWNLGHPNQLFYVLAYIVSFVMPVELACKLVVAASVAAVPLGAARLARHAGVSPVATLVAAPLALGLFYYWGFVGNLLALGLTFATLPDLDALARAPTPRGAVRATAILLALYLAHDSALVVGCVAVVVLSLGRPLLERATAWRVVPLFVAGGVAVLEMAYSIHRAGPNLRGLPLVIDFGFEQKLEEMPKAFFGLRNASSMAIAFWIIVACLVLLAAQRIVAVWGRPSPEVTRALYDAHRFAVLGVVVGAGYFLAPFAYTGAMWLNARFLPPAVVFLAVGLAPRLPDRPWLAARLAGMVSLLAVVGLFEREQVQTAQVYAELDPLLSHIVPGSAIAAVDLYGSTPIGYAFTVPGAAARAASERGGRMATSFVQTSPIPSVVVAPEHRWEDPMLRLLHDPLSLAPARDLRRFRYVLSWVPEGQGRALTAALSPEAQLVARSGAWVLFESTLPVEPVTSPYEPPREGQTVRERLAHRE